MRYITKKVVFAAGLALAFTSCSDFNDYNSVPTDTSNPKADKTLLANIQENANLKDFVSIINKAKYAENLNASQCYTLWAPLDGTYDASKILALDSVKIVDRFINMHLAQFSHPVSGIVDETIISLNDKHHSFTNLKGVLFDNLQIKDANIPSTNGLIHTISGASEYHPNIYQYMDEVKGCDSLVMHVHQYDETYIDKKKSIEGPMVKGQQTYLDTVLAKQNTLIASIMKADIQDEDSSYTVLFPTNDAWQEAKDRIKPLYKYISPVNYMDVTTNNTPAASLTATTAKSLNPVQIDADLYCDSLPKSQIMRNLSFSNSYIQNKQLIDGASSDTDSLFSTNRTKLSNVSEILSYCGELQPMSNGYTRTLSSLCFKPWETYETVHNNIEPVRMLGLKTGVPYTVNTYVKDTFVKEHWDKIKDLPDYVKTWIFDKNSGFFNYISTDSINLQIASSKPELDFALQNVLSTKYHIFVVLVPSQVKEPERPVSDASNEIKNLYLRFDMSYTDADGTQKYNRLNTPDAKKVSDDILVVNDGKFHVVELEFTFPICYFGLQAYPTLFMSLTKSFTSTANRRKFEQELRVAGVFLVPDDVYDYVKSLKF
ncbi:MAG: fasciclin domain-containing protein [Bacteroidaceae bacterium]|nr:fasciclin domain-containing protein [Bacteroidaceae bacterium]